MPPLNALDTWSSRSEPQQKRKPKARCFLIAEGANTEYWYLSELAQILSKRNLPARIELKTVERTGDDRGSSHPKKLAEYARTIQEDAKGQFGFDRATDSTVIIFDADIYKEKPDKFTEDLEEFERTTKVAVTNPSFELFLLLHVNDAVEKIILPHKTEILENSYHGRQRFVTKLASDTFKMNAKSNPRVGQLAEKFDIAKEEEKKLNQDSALAIGQIASNIAATIESIIEEGQ